MLWRRSSGSELSRSSIPAGRLRPHAAAAIVRTITSAKDATHDLGSGTGNRSHITRIQSFKSPAIASVKKRYSYLCIVLLFELTCNLAAIVRYSLI